MIDLNDDTRRANVHGKPNSRQGERYELIPELDAGINDIGVDTTGAAVHTLHRQREDVHGERQTRSPHSENSRYGFILHAYVQF